MSFAIIARPELIVTAPKAAAVKAAPKARKAPAKAAGAKRLTLREEAEAAIAAAREDRFGAMFKLVNKLQSGLLFNGQLVTFGYKDMAAFFARGGVSADEFEEFMQGVDAYAATH